MTLYLLNAKAAAPCPVCGGRDLRLAYRTPASIWVRVECECGVAGPWASNNGVQMAAPAAALAAWQRLPRHGRVPFRGTIGGGGGK